MSEAGGRVRTIVFLDTRNVYKGARDAFFDPTSHFTAGQFDPHALARLLTQRSGSNRDLEQVRSYTGQPSAARQPRAYRAARRQYATWRRRGIHVTARPLRYPPTGKPQEKGIDVELAIDMATLALDGAFDLAILFSSDTDSIPALNFVIDRAGLRVEVAAWRGRSRLEVSRRAVWCHFLDRSDYDLASDPTDYTR